MVNKKILKSKSKSFCTLIDLSIVILILAVLIKWGLTITTGSFNKTNAVENRIFSIVSGYFNGVVGSGVYANPTNPNISNIFYGMITVKTLNLPLNMGEDDFVSKISYVTDQKFTTNFQEAITNTDSGFGTSSPYTSIITVKEKSSSILRYITQDEILVSATHRLNKYLDFNAHARIQNSRSSDLDEKENDHNPYFYFLAKVLI